MMPGSRIAKVVMIVVAVLVALSLVLTAVQYPL